MRMQTLLSATDIGFELPHKTLFKALSVSIARGDRIGLIGKNGEGKSTFLKILSGAIEPTSGRVDAHGKAHYVAQLDFALFEKSDTVAEFLKRRALSWPLVQASLARIFSEIHIVQNKEVRALSGGELAKLLIAIADSDNPDVLLLDEPTNHLDAEGLEVLKNYLHAFRGAFVVVSHDPLFLEYVASTIWEIDQGNLIHFKGTYSAYQDQKKLADEARERALEAARKGVRKAHRAIEASQTRVSRASRAGKRSKAEPSRDKFAEGFFRGQSEKTAGKIKRQQDQMLEEREQRVSEFRKPKRKTTHIGLDEGAERSKRMLVSVSDGSVSIANRKLIEHIDLRIEFGDRIVITGKNGSGKSLFVKGLMGIQNTLAIEGVVKRGEGIEAVYMDQKYHSIDPELSILDTMLQANPNLDEQAARTQLGTYLFGTEISVTTKAGMLSGGETARLVLAQITAKPIDLLVLDEPTNNLDIETLDIIADALKDFKGALLVISHNIHFLAQLEIQRAYLITGQRLKKMRFLPEESMEFYSELVATE